MFLEDAETDTLVLAPGKMTPKDTTTGTFLGCQFPVMARPP
jgi:hypothetical protein